MTAAAVPECMANESVCNGFTVISDKTKELNVTASERLPSWILSAAVFPADVNVQQDVNECLEISPLMRQRLMEMGHTKLFPVQSRVIPFILQSYSDGKHRPLFRPVDICISAPTGSGKTLAYCVPIVQLLLRRVKIFVRALVIVPVRDLACQVYNVFRALTVETDLKVVLICGLKSFSKEQSDLVDHSNMLMPKADIVIATPGRFVDHICNTPGFSMERLRILVIDEADRVIAEERQDWYRLLEDSIYLPNVYTFDMNLRHAFIKSAPVRSPCSLSIMHQFDYSQEITIQKILVSATLTHDPGPLKRFNLYFPRLFTSDNPTTNVRPSSSHSEITPIIKQLSKRNNFPNRAAFAMDEVTIGDVNIFSTPTGLKECVVNVPVSNRTLFLLHLIKHQKFNRILCFTNARLTTERLYLLLKNFSWLKASRLSAQMPTTKRQRILNAFSHGKTNILVCTDSMARGMDIKDVECVVSYEMPPNVKTYVHRVGRTARAGQPGVAFTLLSRNQFFHFKKDLRAVGKTKVKEIAFHASRVGDLKAEYKLALRKLEQTVKASSRLTVGQNASALHISRSQSSTQLDVPDKQSVSKKSKQENSSE